MNIIERNVAVRMVRHHLAHIPTSPLPVGYCIRFYAPGDEVEWVRLQEETDQHLEITMKLFRSEFGQDAAPLIARQLYLCDTANHVVGTTTAWFDDDCHGEPFGRIHWVAIHPKYQGHGLSKPLLSKACERLAELGHTRAYLMTSTARIPAINLYLSFGFEPDIRTPQDRSAWAEMAQHLKYPVPSC
jgi:GNAT superfamily N-acetyltransferase